jgi:hypothetical protein
MPKGHAEKDILHEARKGGRKRLEQIIFWMDDKLIRGILTMIGCQTDNSVGNAQRIVLLSL